MCLTLNGVQSVGDGCRRASNSRLLGSFIIHCHLLGPVLYTIGQMCPFSGPLSIHSTVYKASVLVEMKGGTRNHRK
jgi:hypothetical protein